MNRTLKAKTVMLGTALAICFGVSTPCDAMQGGRKRSLGNTRQTGTNEKKGKTENCLHQQLLDAVTNGDPVATLTCLNAGANPNTIGHDNLTPLHYACMHGHTECAELLINYGTDVDATDVQGLTPLDYACMYGHTACAKLLLSCGANVNATNKNGLTPLQYACWYGHSECSQLLIDRGADVNTTDKNFWTPLHRACMFDQPASAQLLITLGADVNATNVYKKTPLYYARAHNYTALVDAIESYVDTVQARIQSATHP